MPNDIDFSIWNPQVFSALGSPAIEYAQGIEVVIVGPTSIRLRTSDVFVDLILVPAKGHAHFVEPDISA